MPGENDNSLGVTSSSYLWNAADYAQHSSAQFEWACELIDKLRLQENEAVLDLGCGDGRVSAVLAARVPQGQVIGVDSSEEMIALASRNYPRVMHPNLSFEMMDARRLTFHDCFNVAFSNAALHWVADQRAVLRGVRKSLKAAGRLLFQMGGKRNAHEIIAVLDEQLSQQNWSSYFEGFAFPYTFCGDMEYKGYLEEAGLQAVRVELVRKDMRQRGREGLAGWIRTTWFPYTQRVPEHLQGQFISEIVDSYLKFYPLDNQGLAHVAMVRLEVEAKVGEEGTLADS
jgi:trans-aconitate 2-methyltransferase